MTLSAQSIRARCTTTPPLIDPFVERSVSPGGRSFGLSAVSYDVRIDQDVIIHPYGFLRASTIERLIMPDDLAGVVFDKSSWARVGLSAFNTLLDPGWCGYLTLELANHSNVEITIERGEPIAQIVFELLDQPTEQPYSGKYQNQERGPQPARQENAQATDTAATMTRLESRISEMVAMVQVAAKPSLIGWLCCRWKRWRERTS